MGAIVIFFKKIFLDCYNVLHWKKDSAWTSQKGVRPLKFLPNEEHKAKQGSFGLMWPVAAYLAYCHQIYRWSLTPIEVVSHSFEAEETL